MQCYLPRRSGFWPRTGFPLLHPEEASISPAIIVFAFYSDAVGVRPLELLCSQNQLLSPPFFREIRLAEKELSSNECFSFILGCSLYLPLFRSMFPHAGGAKRGMFWSWEFWAAALASPVFFGIGACNVLFR